jgi:LacI family transcriptional regulator
VGVGTVSRVINGSPHVRPETRARVLRAMREVEYRPLAREALSTPLRVVVLAPFGSRPATACRLRGIASVLSGQGMDLVLVDVRAPEQRDLELEALISGARGEPALLVSLAPSDREADGLRRRASPVVLLDCHHPSLPRVVLDDVRAGSLATGHLLALGHRRIAFVGDETDSGFGFTSSTRRLQGYRTELRSAGVAPDPLYIRTGAHAAEVARELTRELLALSDPPTAIVAASDTQALGVIDGAALSGVHVPGGLSVIGVDDLDVSDAVGLSTVRQPLFESGAIAARMLVDELGEPAMQPPERRLDLEVVGRRTTKIHVLTALTPKKRFFVLPDFPS